MLFKIGGLPLSLCESTDETVRKTPDLSLFRCREEECFSTQPLRIAVLRKSHIPIPRSVDFRIDGYAFSCDGTRVCVFCETSDEAMIEWKSGKDALLFERKDTKSDLRMTMLQFAFSSFLAKNRGMLMHGAILDYKGRGVIFTAPSGGGKTTHTKLWQKVYKDASLLNGDKTLLRLNEEEMPIVYGSPWAGSSDIRVNRSVPLHGIVILEKASENSMERLSTSEGAALLSPRIYYPFWDEKAVDEVLSVLDVTLSEIPVWRLRCLPCEDAVRLAHDMLFSEDDE